MSVEALEFAHEDTSDKKRRVDVHDESSEKHDLVRFYLDDIGRVALLSAAEEVELAQQIEAGLYAGKLLETADVGESVGGIEPTENLTRAKRRDLNTVVTEGDAAKRRMLEANLRLVVSLAKRYSGKGMPLLDMIQEGNLGLVRAVEKFDYAKGYKFSTYATWWIRQSITRGIADQGRTIRMPVHLVEKRNKINRMQFEIRQELGREATLEELAMATEMPAAVIEDILEVSKDPVSLNMLAGEANDAEFGEFLIDHSEVTVAEHVERRMMQGDIMKILQNVLDEREVTVITQRFGLNGDPKILDDIGEVIGVTRERVRQIETSAMEKLRESGAADHLKVYLSE